MGEDFDGVDGGGSVVDGFEEALVTVVSSEDDLVIGEGDRLVIGGIMLGDVFGGLSGEVAVGFEQSSGGECGGVGGVLELIGDKVEFSGVAGEAYEADEE